jgi:hypothetical protein
MNRNLAGTKSVITPLSDKRTVSEGSLVYGLPLTVIDVEIEAERVIEKPGPYSRFAGDLLGLTDVIQAEKEHWTITGINVSTHEELDPEEFYVIEASTIFQTNVLALKKSGLILDLNPDLFNSYKDKDQNNPNDLSYLRVYDLGSDEYFQEKRDTLYKIVSVDTAFVRIPYLVEKKQKLTIDQLAEKAAIRLMELRDGKHLILTGETNLFPQDEAAIKEMNRLEKEYTELFTGKILKERRIFNYQVIPRKDLTGKQVTLCTFSELTGPSESSEKSVSPVVIDFTPEMKTRNLNIISGKSGVTSAQKYDKLFYRVPDVVNVRVLLGNEVLNKSRKLVYQLGEIVRLPANYIIGK